MPVNPNSVKEQNKTTTTTPSTGIKSRPINEATKFDSLEVSSYLIENKMAK